MYCQGAVKNGCLRSKASDTFQIENCFFSFCVEIRVFLCSLIYKRSSCAEVITSKLLALKKCLYQTITIIQHCNLWSISSRKLIWREELVIKLLFFPSSFMHYLKTFLSLFSDQSSWWASKQKKILSWPVLSIYKQHMGFLNNSKMSLMKGVSLEYIR